MKIETPEQDMLDLNWTKEILEESKDLIKKLDERDHNGFYKNVRKDTVKFDKKEREHFRNCINFWSDKLK